MNRGLLEAARGNQEYWFEVIWYDATQQEMVALVSVLEHPFPWFDTKYPFVLLVRTSVQCAPQGPPSFSFAAIGSTDHNYLDVSLSKWAPWTVERRDDELMVSLKGGGTWVLTKPVESVSP